MTPHHDDERAAREAADSLGLQHAQLREHAYQVILTARQSARAEALKYAAGLITAEAEKRTAIKDGLRCSFDGHGEHSLMCDACGMREQFAHEIAEMLAKETP